MKKMLVLMVVAALVAGSAFVALADNGPETITLEASMGNITFPHAVHQGMEGVGCNACHHNGEATAVAADPNCHACHGAKDGVPATKKVFHKLCKDCHKEKGGNAPTKCKGCHVK